MNQFISVKFVALTSIFILLPFSGSVFGQAAVQMCNSMTVTIDLNDPASPSPTRSDSDVILGTPQNDSIDAGDGDDVICGGMGNDTIEGLSLIHI